MARADSRSPTEPGAPVGPAKAMVLVIVDGDSAGRTFPVTGAVSIGRDASAGIVLDDDQVSRRHAVVTAAAAGGAPASVDDLESTNGTWVNGRRIDGATTLCDGDVLTIGETTLRVRALRPGVTPLPRAVLA